jgi:hypothetical protein
MKRWAVVVALVVLLAFAVPSAASAEFGIVPGGVTFQALDSGSLPDNRAGGHPHRVLIGLELEATGDEVDENLRDFRIELPPGLLGSPTAVPTCPRKVFEEGVFDDGCPTETQVGSGLAEIAGFDDQEIDIFNIEPASGQLVVMGFALFGKFPIVLRLRPDDYGATIEQTGLSQALPLSRLQIELWGVPADHQVGTSIPRRPFLTMPTRCDTGPPAIEVSIRSWQQPGVWLSAGGNTGFPLTGCQDLPFAPQIGFQLDSPVPDAPTGAEIQVSLPQSEDPDGRATSHLRRVTVALPEGMAISPAGLWGRGACTDAEFGLGQGSPESCPPTSRIGTVTLASPILREPMSGWVFLGQEAPGDRFRLFVSAGGPGLEAKLGGSLHADPLTGRLTAVLSDLPQIPLGQMTLRFNGGPGALLATPLACGPATASASFEPYSGGPPVASSATVAIQAGAPPAGCSPGFSPGFEAGVSTPRAGDTTPLSVTLRRRDGEQGADRFAIDLPRGLSAALGSVTGCPEAAAAAMACPAESRIGSAVAEVGSGPAPVPLQGSAYLTGPYRGAPFGLSLVFDATVGPFDLGTLAVRATMRLDSSTGQVTIETDSLPQLVEGIPVRFQTIGLDIDRAGFIRNPTACASQAFAVTMRSTGSVVSTASAPFFLRGCDSLRFRPRASLRLTGGSQLRRHDRPGLRIRVRAPDGSANLRQVVISLPDALGFSLSGLRELCPRRDAIADRCPTRSRVGLAEARTPLLQTPLTGAIHVVQPEGEGLPDLWLSLEALGIRLALAGETARRGGQVTSSFTSLPDIPLSLLRMRFAGGEAGVISLRRDLCRGGGKQGLRSLLRFEGQNKAYRRSWAAIGVDRGCGDSGQSERGSHRGRPVRDGDD